MPRALCTFSPGANQKRRTLADICSVSCCLSISFLRTSPRGDPQRGYAENRPHRSLLREAQPTEHLGGCLPGSPTVFAPKPCFSKGVGDIRLQGASARPCCLEISRSVLLRLPWNVIEASSCLVLPPSPSPSPSPFRHQACARVRSLPTSSASPLHPAQRPP